MLERKLRILNSSYTANQCVTEESSKRTVSSRFCFCFFPSAFTLPLLIYLLVFHTQEPSLSSPAPMWFTWGEHISICSGGGHGMGAWLYGCDRLKAGTRDSIWVNGSLPRTVAGTTGQEMHCEMNTHRTAWHCLP